MRQIDLRDLIAGALLAGLGVFVALYSAGHYTVGEAQRMGPGFFPFALGWILAGLGTLVMLSSLGKGARLLDPPPFAWRPFVAVLVAILVFGLLIDRVGLVIATVLLTLLAAFAERPYKLRRTILLGGSLALMAWLIFTVGLQMTLPAFTFLG